MRKRLGVNADGSSGSLDRKNKGLELRHASICVVSVVNSSRVRHAIPITLLTWYLNNLTPASQIPPK
jgi:hypothetical protein